MPRGPLPKEAFGACRFLKWRPNCRLNGVKEFNQSEHRKIFTIRSTPKVRELLALPFQIDSMIT